VARKLHAPLDVFVVRKLGLPGHEELAMGAIATGGIRVLNTEVIEPLRIPDEVIDAVAADEQRELVRRERAYRDDLPAPDVAGKTVILVDDGSASVAAIQGAIKALRSMQVGSLRLALPFARADVVEVLAGHVDEVISLSNNAGARAAYLGSSATTDQEAVRLLRQVRKLGRMLH